MTNVPRYGQPDLAYAQRLATTPPEDDGPVWMINLMNYRERADYGDGDDRGLTGRDADNLYAPFGPLQTVGADVVFAAEVDQQILGDQPSWDRVAIVRYPTRRAFMQMQTLPEFQELHVHKEASMASTIVMGGLPIDVGTVSETPWDDVPHPPTDDDPAVVVIHVIRFHDTEVAGQTPEHMQAYQSAAAVPAVNHGVRLPAWFAIEGTIVGDGRQWHQARFNAFPSKRAFMAVVTDPDRLEAQAEHRDTAIADTYTMILRPIIDNLAASIEP